MNRDQLNDTTPYGKLKNMILTGEIIPGARITEGSLSDKLEVSRIPVREAIQQLLHEGFIDRNGKNGYQIKTYDEQDIIDLYNYREAMDGMLVRLFTHRADPSQIYYLEITVENLKSIIEEFNPSTLLKNDLDFHRTIARGSKNVYMQQQHEIILEKVLYVAQTLIRFGEDSVPGFHGMAHYEDIYDEHLNIIKAIKDKDPDAAEKAARESVQAGLKKTLMTLAYHRQS